ncbi:glycoprotein integral membrane protein 1 [Gastrophryne carolinensis]
MAPSAGPVATFFILLLLLSHSLSSAEPASIQELVTVTVTSLHETKEVTEQVSYNISYDRGQVYLNGYPLSKGVSRISSKMNIVGDDSYEALVSMRVLVLHSPTNDSTGEEQIVLQQEVISMDGNQAKQNVTMEVKLVVDNNTGVLQFISSPITVKDTLLHHIPWNKDIVFTFPNLPQSADGVPQDTTREYNVRQNTTLDEKQFTGELPETPLRAVIPSSSYKVMCQFADDLREKLCLFWKELYPVLVRVVEVFVVGVIAAALILELLKLVYPHRQVKGILHPSDSKDPSLLFPLMLSHDKMTVKALEKESIP